LNTLICSNSFRGIESNDPSSKESSDYQRASALMSLTGIASGHLVNLSIIVTQYQ